jgi:hypothetical protein
MHWQAERRVLVRLNKPQSLHGVRTEDDRRMMQRTLTAVTQLLLTVASQASECVLAVALHADVPSVAEAQSQVCAGSSDAQIAAW